jgi:hypothetical protein
MGGVFAHESGSPLCEQKQEGIVNFNFSLDELSPANPQFSAFRACFFGQHVGSCPAFPLHPAEIPLQLPFG